MLPWRLVRPRRASELLNEAEFIELITKSDNDIQDKFGPQMYYGGFGIRLAQAMEAVSYAERVLSEAHLERNIDSLASEKARTKISLRQKSQQQKT